MPLTVEELSGYSISSTDACNDYTSVQWLDLCDYMYISATKRFDTCKKRSEPSEKPSAGSCAPDALLTGTNSVIGDQGCTII